MRFRTNYFDWAGKLTIPGDKGHSWLWYDVKDNHFRWSCTVCDSNGAEYVERTHPQFGAAPILQLCNLKRHGKSGDHQKNLTGDLKLELIVARGERSEWFPPAQLFRDVWAEVRKGNAPGEDGYSSKVKV